MSETRFILHLLYDVNIGIDSAEHCLFRPSNNFLQMTKEFESFAKTFQVFVGCVFSLQSFGLRDSDFCNKQVSVLEVCQAVLSR